MGRSNEPTGRVLGRHVAICDTIRFMKKLLSLASYFAASFLVMGLLGSQALAATWNGIEPFKSRRTDLERVLGKPIGEDPNGALRFNVAGGTALVSFVDAKFVANKKLRPDIEGTVMQIVLQHENSSDTPDSMGLTRNRAFEREDLQGASIFRNPKEGVFYTFLNGRLRTTRYSFSTEQLSHARRGGR
jgi:hypothetical protein